MSNVVGSEHFFAFGGVFVVLAVANGSENIASVDVSCSLLMIDSEGTISYQV